MPLSSYREFDAALAFAAESVERTMERLLPRSFPGENNGEDRVFEAMRYSSLGGGKRLRAFFVLAGATLFKVGAVPALRTASAIEFVHAYSLIHDDLPAMDDDDLRRGRPTTHKQFDEATAILAGDALLTLAFEVLAHPDTHPDGAVRSELVAALASGAGAVGMVGGQMFDLEAEQRGKSFSLADITRLQSMKTGRLIGFACEAGAILGQASAAARKALAAYAEDLGLAFQIADDLLDAEGTEAEVGKKVGKDAAAGKATFITHLGLEGARQRAQSLALQAAKHLDLYGSKAQILSNVARFVVERRT
jgi:farnesyl diphosphate synthase